MALDRPAAISWYQRTRQRSRALFDMLPEDVYFSQPIALRHPIVFYDGHLPAFSFNTLVKKALGEPSIDPGLEQIFARGLDPGGRGVSHQESDVRSLWPDRASVAAFVAEADRRVIQALGRS